MDEDEDVVIKGSPLYAYMKEIDPEFEEFATTERNRAEPLMRTKSNCLIQLWSYLISTCRGFTSIPYYLCSALLEQTIHTILDCIAHGNCMDDGDVEFILYNLHLVKSGNTLSEQTVLAKIFYLSLSVAVVGVAAFISWFLWIFVLILVILISVLLIYCYFWWQQKKCLNNVICFLKTVDEFFLNARKLAQFLQEMDIMNKSLSGLKRDTGLQEHDGNFTRVRFELFKEVRSVIGQCRTETKLLLDSFAECEETSDRSCYLADSPISSFGDMFICDVENKSEVMGSTDNLAMSAIKATIHLLFVQQSEYFRAFAINCLRHGRNRKYFSLLNADKSLRRLHDRMQISHKIVKDLYDDLTLHKRQLRDSKKLGAKKACMGVRADPVLSRIHSAQLHLCSALELCVDIETFIQGQSKDTRNDIGVSSVLDGIQSHLDVAVSCVADAQIYSRKTNDPHLPIAKLNIQPGENNDGPPCLIDLINYNPVISDQVFELEERGSSTGSDYDMGDDLEEETMVTTRQRQNAQCLFKELKTILVTRAHQWRRRELVAQGLDQESIDKELAKFDDTAASLTVEKNVFGCDAGREKVIGRIKFTCDDENVRNETMCNVLPSSAVLAKQAAQLGLVNNLTGREQCFSDDSE